MAGRPRKPDEIKILDGTFRQDRDGSPASVPMPAGEPVAPSYLKGEAKSFWDEVVSRLVPGMARESDSAELAMMCQWWARAQRFGRALDRMKTTDRGLSKLVLATGIAWTNFDKIASRFGLTPSDRAKLRVESTTKKAGVMTRKRNA